MNATIDFRSLAERADLRRLIEEDRGPPDRSRRWLCPFHDDHSPDLNIDPTRNRWKCWACGANGDAIDWLTEHRGMSKIQAAAHLGADVDGDRPGKAPRRPATRPDGDHGGSDARTVRDAALPPPAWSDPAWQAVVDRIIRRAEDDLWSPAGRPALEWLHSRGLADFTIRLFRLGFIARGFRTEPLDCLPKGPHDEPTGIYAQRGVLFPYILPGSWHSSPTPSWAGANVRKLAEGDVFAPVEKRGRYRALNETERGHLYPHPDVEETQGEPTALILEGEVDALIGWQEAGHVVQAGTVGSASGGPKPSALAALARCPRWLVTTDYDDSGSFAAWEWRERSPEKARRALLPLGKDLGEFHQAGGDVVSWLRAEHDRLVWPWPLDPR